MQIFKICLFKKKNPQKKKKTKKQQKMCYRRNSVCFEGQQQICYTQAYPPPSGATIF